MGLYQTLDREILHDLYVGQGLSLSQVAARLGPPASKRVVQRALEWHGIELRPARPPARVQESMPRADLERLYVDEGRSLPEVAAHFGVAIGTVIRRMRALGIDRRTGAWRSVGDRVPLTRDLLHELRVEQAMSAAAIAAELGYSQIQVSSALRRHRVGDSWRKGGSLAQQLGAGELWHLHHHRDLSLRQIAEILHTNSDAVATRMRQLGLPLGPAGSNARPSATTPGAAVPAPDHDLLDEVLAAAAARLPKPAPPARPLGAVSDQELRRLHEDEGIGLTDLALRYRVSLPVLHRRMAAAGIDVVDRRGRRAGVTRDPEDQTRLAELYRRADVAAALDRLAVPEQPPRGPAPITLTRARLVELYEGLGLSGDEVALLLGCSRGAVDRAMQRHGLRARRRLPRPEPPRSPGARIGGHTRPATIAPADILDLAAQGLDAEQVAAVLGLPSATTVRIVLQVLEVPQPGGWQPAPIPAKVAAVLRRERIDPQHAAVVLDPHRRGVAARRDIPRWPWPPDPALLRYLYGDLHLGMVEIAARLRVAHHVLPDALRAAGIPLRHEAERVERRRVWRLDIDELRRLYVEQDWSSAQVAVHLGVSEALVLRALHRHHLPVHPTGGSGHKRVRYDDLLADRRVRAALRVAGLRAAGVDPPILRRPLDPQLLRDLLVERRLTSFDVELLTGRPARDVNRDAAAHDIHPGDLPPGVTVDQLRRAYTEDHWSITRICAEFGVAGRRTLFSLLDAHGIARRDRPANPWDTRRAAGG